MVRKHKDTKALAANDANDANGRSKNLLMRPFASFASFAAKAFVSLCFLMYQFQEVSMKVVLVGSICLLLVLVSVPVFSQGNTGRILGSVTDATGAVIGGVRVTVTDVDRGTSRVLVTDEAGAYNAPSLPPGTYRVGAELTGFKTVERPNIVLEVGRELKVDFTLEPGAISEKVTVTDEAPMVETANAVLGGTLQPGTIADLPLNGRNFMNLLQLRPGVTIYPGGGAWTQTTNGLRPEHHQFGQPCRRRRVASGDRHHSGVCYAAEPESRIRLEARFGHECCAEVGNQRISRNGQLFWPHRQDRCKKPIPCRRSEAANQPEGVWRHCGRTDQER